MWMTAKALNVSHQTTYFYQTTVMESSHLYRQLDALKVSECKPVDCSYLFVGNGKINIILQMKGRKLPKTK
jgi:hypothetical protein